MLASVKFHHVGIATSQLEKSIQTYESLGYVWQNSEIFHDRQQNVRIAFMTSPGHPLLELVAPVDSTSPVNNILKKVRTSPYHTCYEVPDLALAIATLKGLRFVVIVPPVEAIAFGGRQICFLYHREVGLIELLAETTNSPSIA